MTTSSSASGHGGTPPEISCSFCGKHRREVNRLIAGPAVYICNECILLCHDILEDEAAPDDAGIPEQLDFERTLEAHLVGAVAARRAIVAALRRHFLASPPARAARVLVVGPVGSGKTTLGRALCAATDLPSYHADAGWLSQPVGENVESLLTGLLRAASGSRDQAGQGVLFLDDLEKIKADPPHAQARNVSGETAQRELLWLLDGVSVKFRTNESYLLQKSPGVDWRGILVVAAARLPGPLPGSERALRDALVGAGFLPELVARFDRVVAMTPLDTEGLIALLDHPRGPLAETNAVVETLGGTLAYEPAALRALATAAAGSPEGAWVLRHVLHRKLEEIVGSPAPARAWRIDEQAMAALLRA
jgi:ATP-dependent Clp protease ATP-binding subunit ClpX